jgi:hypothetical protein
MVGLSVAIIRLYQLVAPARLRQSCRFEPTCSEYAILALQKFGFVNGWRLALSRLYRCRPSDGGVDMP